MPALCDATELNTKRLFSCQGENTWDDIFMIAGKMQTTNQCSLHPWIADWFGFFCESCYKRGGGKPFSQKLISTSAKYLVEYARYCTWTLWYHPGALWALVYYWCTSAWFFCRLSQRGSRWMNARTNRQAKKTDRMEKDLDNGTSCGQAGKDLNHVKTVPNPLYGSKVQVLILICKRLRILCERGLRLGLPGQNSGSALLFFNQFSSKSSLFPENFFFRRKQTRKKKISCPFWNFILNFPENPHFPVK